MDLECGAGSLKGFSKPVTFARGWAFLPTQTPLGDLRSGARPFLCNDFRTLARFLPLSKFTWRYNDEKGISAPMSLGVRPSTRRFAAARAGLRRQRDLGEIKLAGKSRVEKTSGVWVDGKYVGYLKELKGSKRLLLLPGEHTILVRQDGYQDFTEQITVLPGQQQVVHVAMAKAPTGLLPLTSTVEIAVNPSRAAVFVDGLFVGHVAEFTGWGRGMLVAPGVHKIRIALPGYQTFETDINAVAKQKVKIKTDLIESNALTRDPLLETGEVNSTGDSTTVRSAR